MIKVYYKDGCGSCVKVKTILNAYGIKYEQINLSEKERREERAMIRDKNIKTLPVIVLENGNMISDCSEESIMSLIRFGDIK